MKLHSTLAVGLLFSLALASGATSAAAPASFQFKQGQPGKAAVLLIHGLASSSRHFLNPATAWSIRNGHFDHASAPGKPKGSGEHPKAGLHDLALSPVDGHAGPDGSYWTQLSSKGFTVATWDQTPCMDEGSMPSAACLDSDTFDAVYATALAAFNELAQRTAAQKLPIALVGHSRGGLVARRLLKEVSAKKLPGSERIKWMITLHTPHHGSSLSTAGVKVQEVIGGLSAHLDLGPLDKVLHGAIKGRLSSFSGKLHDAMEGLVKAIGLRGGRELAKDGPLYKALEQGEVKVPGVKVVTFGGNSPRIALLNALVYSPGSAKPHEVMKQMGKIKRPGTVYHWEAQVHQLLDFPGSLKLPMAEMRAGGDLLVTEGSSHFKFEDEHRADAHNHAEVLWGRDVQDQVAAILAK